MDSSRAPQDDVSPQPVVQREGRGEPLMLMHGITGSARMWRHVVPLLAAHHDVIVPTALGHRGGAVVSERPARFKHVFDDAERLLDRLGLARVHLAGNSMGGWAALELARRDRALSVTALSPAGAWSIIPKKTRRLLTALSVVTRISRPLLPLLARSAIIRRLSMRDSAMYGDRVTRDELLALADDMLGCSVMADLLASSENLPVVKAGCPITIAWSEYDRILPLRDQAPVAAERVPGARSIVLANVGHVPMFDDPQLVANTILDCTGALAHERVGAGSPQP